MSHGDGILVLTPGHEFPAKQAATAAEAIATTPVNDAKPYLRSMLERAGFPAPTGQKTIDLGRAFGGVTIPDFFFEPPNDVNEGVCISLDGLSAHLHGDTTRAERDRQVRDHLRNLGYTVIAIPYRHLSDREAMQQHFYRLGRCLSGRAHAEAVCVASDHWFSDVSGTRRH